MIRRKGILIKKIAREFNAADSLASYAAPAVLQKHTELLGCRLHSFLGMLA